MTRRTVLCTVCYEPVGPHTVTVQGSDAVFCSDACREKDPAIHALRQAMRDRKAEEDAAADARPRVLVAIVHNQPSVAREVAQNFIAMGWGNRVQSAKDAYGIASIDMAWYTKAPRVDDLRNMALYQAMADGFSHVLFLDADMLHPDDLFMRILKYVDRPIVVSGFYTQRQYPFAPIALFDGTLHESGRFTSYRYDADYRTVDADGLHDVQVVGMGCCLIPLAIVRALGPRPWFEYKTDADGWHFISEDVPFCEKVRAAGFRVSVDPSIGCGHLFTEFATEAHWKRAHEVLQHTQAKVSEALTLGVDVAASADVATAGGG
jgi:hypothetical protein